jgi:CheY-like chemotaxis protein
VATILVADDNSNIQKMVTLALKNQGIDVFAVGNGEAAVRKLPDVRPDLILADIFMPVRNGYEVCEFVKQDARYAHIPVILLVGAFDPFDEREAQRVGADGVLKKPFVPPDPLISMVKSVLAKSADERLASVAAVVAAPVAAGASLPSTAAQELVEPEPASEEYSTQPQRVAFREGEKPLAFGELLEPPSVEAEPEAEHTSPPGAALGGMRFWEAPPAAQENPPEPEAPAWTGPEDLPPAHQEFVLTEPPAPAGEKSSQSAAVAEVSPAPPELAPPEMAGSAAELIQAGPPGLVEAPAPEPLPMASAEEEEEASGWAEPAPESPEPAPASWSSPVVPSALASQPAPASFSPETVRADAVQSFEVPQPANPELVDAVVAQVIERMQPQLLEIVTREILKPVVEALVRRELEKHPNSFLKPE